MANTKNILTVSPVESENTQADDGLYHYAHGTVTVNGAECRYTATIPNELVMPELTLLVSGIGAFKKTMRGPRNAMSSQGVAAVSYAPVRNSNRGWFDDLANPTGLHVDTVSAILDSLPDNKQLKDTPNGDKLSFDKANLVSHSYGSEPAVKYALKHPGNVANLVLVEPVGFEDPDLFRFNQRFTGFVFHDFLSLVLHHGPDFSFWDAEKAITHFFSNTMLTTGELIDSVVADDRHHLSTFRKQRIGTALLTGRRDHLLPPGPTAKSATLVDYYEMLDMDHFGPQKKPALTAEAVIRAIGILNRKHAKARARSHLKLVK